MKKFLVLMLVLGLTSSASAVLSNITLSLDGATPAPSDITLYPSDTVIIDIHHGATDTGLAYLYFGPIDDDVYTLSNAVVLDPAGDLKSYVQYVEAGYDGFEVTVDDTDPEVMPNITVGVIFEVTLHCEGAGDVAIALYDSDFASVLDSMTIHQIPEPMTVALLGLGGLFLRRRK